MAATRLGTDDDGRPVVVKEGPAAAREAEVLAAARHPGVVEVAGWDAGAARLVLRWVGSRTLAEHRPPPEAAARILAGLAATVADLHALGIRHGRITASRVVLDGADRPVLCGFGGAALAGEEGPTPADDVAALGALLRAVAGPDVELEPIPARRIPPVRLVPPGFARPPRWGGSLQRALLTLADHATAERPERRPTARALAGSLAALVPGADAPDRGVPDRRSRRSRAHGPGADEAGDADDAGDADESARPSPLPLAAAAVGVALLAFAATSSLRTPAAPPGERARVPAPSQAATAPPPVAACDPVDPPAPAADHDGDGCPSAVRVDGGVVQVGGVRYGVGEPGDVLAVGDWDCDGDATVAAVRPSTGEVFVFDGWGPATVAPVTTVAGAVGAEPGACELVVVDRSGGRTAVPS